MGRLAPAMSCASAAMKPRSSPRRTSTSSKSISVFLAVSLASFLAVSFAGADVVVAAGGRGVAVGLVTFGVVVVPGRNLGYRGEESGSR